VMTASPPSAPINECVETREKLARAAYFFLRYLRHRVDRHKITTKDFIKWHKLSQIIERAEHNFCAVFRCLWFGNSLKRLWKMTQASTSRHNKLWRLYSLVTLADEIIEDYLSVQQARLPLSDGHPNPSKSGAPGANTTADDKRSTCGDPAVDLWGINRALTPAIAHKLNAILALAGASLRALVLLTTPEGTKRFFSGFRLLSFGQISVDLYLLVVNLVRTFGLDFAVGDRAGSGAGPLSSLLPVTLVQSNKIASPTPQMLLLAFAGSTMGALKTAM